ncbi:hypothetical protein BH09ACT4_BH09ACT4_18460 [soil metagenome]
MPDGRLKTESGSMLDAGHNLSSADAAVAVNAVSRVLLHSYPDTNDITSDARQIAQLLSSIAIDPELEGHSARLYQRGEDRVLVIEHHH